MTKTWTVWTDGSCVHTDAHLTPRGGRGHGGWAAIVMGGSDGWVCRGREPDTTNVRMELQAAIEGLRSVPAGDRVLLRTDSTLIVVVRERWARNRLAGAQGVHLDLWQELAVELGRREVAISLVVRGDVDPVHKRVDAIAGAEAKAGLNGLAADLTPIELPSRKQQRRWLVHRHDRARERAKLSAPRRLAKHLRGCEPGRCVSACPLGGEAAGVGRVETVAHGIDWLRAG